MQGNPRIFSSWEESPFYTFLVIIFDIFLINVIFIYKGTSLGETRAQHEHHNVQHRTASN